MAQAPDPIIDIPVGALLRSTLLDGGISGYTSDGGSGVWSLRKTEVDAVNNGTEKYQSVRETKWFQLSDYEKPTKVRRIMLSYASKTPVTIEVYKDYELTPSFTLEFPATFQRDEYNIAISGSKMMRYKKATTRARLLKVKIKTQSVHADDYVNEEVEIYGMQVEVVPRREKQD